MVVSNTCTFCDQPKILTPLSQQIGSKDIANRDFLTCVFLHLAAGTCISSEFRLVASLTFVVMG